MSILLRREHVHMFKADHASCNAYEWREYANLTVKHVPYHVTNERSAYFAGFDVTRQLVDSP